ncbi:MAG: hypothetical protein ACE5LD_00100, partial [Candidatus Bipolaricaulia bacterium]
MRLKKVVEASEGPFRLEAGKIARQADGSVIVTFGDTKVLATATRGEAENLDYFPLTVDYEEKFYAGGKIPGGFFKREGKPSEQAVLNARLIDRPIRPLFPRGYREKIHIVVTVLSADKDHPPGVAGILGASTALLLSSIPFTTPVAGVRVGRVDGRLIANPSAAEREESDMDVVIAGTKEAVTMVEGSMKELPEEEVVEAIELAHGYIKQLCEFQERFVSQTDVEKLKVTPPELEGLKERLAEAIGDPEVLSFTPDGVAVSRRNLRIRGELRIGGEENWDGYLRYAQILRFDAARCGQVRIEVAPEGRLVLERAKLAVIHDPKARDDC